MRDRGDLAKHDVVFGQVGNSMHHNSRLETALFLSVFVKGWRQVPMLLRMRLRNSLSAPV